MNTFENGGPQKVIGMCGKIFARFWNVGRYKNGRKDASLTKI